MTMMIIVLAYLGLFRFQWFRFQDNFSISITGIKVPILSSAQFSMNDSSTDCLEIFNLDFQLWNTIVIISHHIQLPVHMVSRVPKASVPVCVNITFIKYYLNALGNGITVSVKYNIKLK